MNKYINGNDKSDSNTEEPKIKLPEPDLENITVLTENLPNKPILPWNRYESDWDDNINQDNDELITDDEE